MLTYKKIIFDDYAQYENTMEKENKIEMWSQVCESCRLKYNIPDNVIDKDAGSGICGIEGCSNESDHYIDFPTNEIIIDSN